MNWNKRLIFLSGLLFVGACSTDPFELDIRATELSAVAIGSTRASVHEVLQEPITDQSAAVVEYLYRTGRVGDTAEDAIFDETGALQGANFFGAPVSEENGSILAQMWQRWADIRETHGVIQVRYDENDKVIAVEKKGVCGQDCPDPLKPPSVYKLIRGY